MCKIITLTNLAKVKNLKKLADLACALVGESERDGYGYAIQGASGVFGERTLRPSDFDSSFKRPLFEPSFSVQHYNRFGTKSKAIGAGLFHGRTSTNDATLINTHPIQKHNWTLIHNGVVSNHGPDYAMITSNDTEHLIEYMATIGSRGIEDHLTGYYAFTAIDPSGRLHVVKDATARLYTAKVMTIDSIIFATKESHITDLCRDMKWTASISSEVIDNTHLIFENGELVHQASIAPRGRTQTETRFASRSLGYDLNDNWSAPLYSTAKTSDYDVSEQAFLDEMDQFGDSSYTIKDYLGSIISLEVFNRLSDDDKLNCTVIRADGTIVDQTDYQIERLYEGA